MFIISQHTGETLYICPLKIYFNSQVQDTYDCAMFCQIIDISHYNFRRAHLTCNCVKYIYATRYYQIWRPLA